MKLWLILLTISACSAQVFTQRGFLEGDFYAFPQTAHGDGGRAVGEAFFNYELVYKPVAWFRFNAGIQAETDTHRETERNFHLSWQDRELQRPAFEMRRFSAAYSKGPLSIELGKQFVRWGKADILNPTDRFAPRDFVNVVRTDYLPVGAGRIIYSTQSDSVDVVVVPRFTPSRLPLLNQRWAPLPVGIPINDLGSHFPGGPEVGWRWNHIGKKAEFSFSFFDGFNTLPLIDLRFVPPVVSNLGLFPPRLDFQRFYPRIQSYGADAAIPLKRLTIKTEAAYLSSFRSEAQHYLLYVIQGERQVGEWSYVAGYAGQLVTEQTPVINFDPDRGLTRAFLGRAGWTIDTNRSLSIEAAVRQNGEAVLVKFEYTKALQAHLRAPVGFTFIQGAHDDFLGQFHRNSFGTLKLRYSF